MIPESFISFIDKLSMNQLLYWYPLSVHPSPEEISDLRDFSFTLDFSRNFLFFYVCEKGDLERVMEVLNRWPVNINEGFNIACQNGHLSVCQFLYSSGASPSPSLFKMVCERGHLDLAKWLNSMGVNKEMNSAFISCCAKGHIGVAQWLHTQERPLEAYAIEAGFRAACEFGHLAVAQFIYASKTIHINTTWALRLSKDNGHTKVTNWLIGLRGHSQARHVPLVI